MFSEPIVPILCYSGYTEDLASQLEFRAMLPWHVYYFNPRWQYSSEIVWFFSSHRYRNILHFQKTCMCFVKQQRSCFITSPMVVDRYDIIHSIKSAEQNSRSITHLKSNVLQVNKGRVIPDWNKFLDSGYNQQSLIICIFWKGTFGFLLDCWRPVCNVFWCFFCGYSGYIITTEGIGTMWSKSISQSSRSDCIRSIK